MDLLKKCANSMTYQLVPVLDFFKSFILASFRKHSYKRGTGFFIDLAYYQGKDRIARPVTEHLVCQRFANFWNVFL